MFDFYFFLNKNFNENKKEFFIISFPQRIYILYSVFLYLSYMLLKNKFYHLIFTWNNYFCFMLGFFKKKIALLWAKYHCKKAERYKNNANYYFLSLKKLKTHSLGKNIFFQKLEKYKIFRVKFLWRIMSN